MIMNYSTSKTLSENIDEQVILGGPAMHYGVTSIVDKLTPNWSDPHSVNQWAEITLTIAGIFAGPAAPLFFAGATYFGVRDGIQYWNEGDKHAAMIFIALSVIPGNELLSLLKKNAAFRKLGKEGTLKLIKLFKEGKLNKVEIDELKSIVDDLFKAAPEVSNLTKIELKRNFVKWLGKQNARTLMNILWFLKKSKIKGISWLGFKIGATWWTADELYLWVFRNDPNVLEKRENSAATKLKNSVSLILEYLKLRIAGLGMSEDEFDKLIVEKLKEQAIKAFDMAQESGVDLVKINDNYINEYETTLNQKYPKKEIENKLYQIKSDYVDAPRLIDVKNGIAELKHGQRGKSIGELQSKLVKLGYEDVLRNFDDNGKSVDNYFGDNTKIGVESFQEDNGLKIDGVVGKKTLKAINDKLNNI